MAYVYRHIREDKNTPFYIGIGSDDYFYRAKEIKRRNAHWNNITNKTKWYYEILVNNLTYEEAKLKEIEFIELYKRTADGGTLVNKTKGGEGTLGLIPVNIKKCFGLSPKGEIREFNSITEAAVMLGNIKHNSNINANISGKVRFVKGWRFANTRKMLLKPVRDIMIGKHKNHKKTIVYGLHLETNKIETFKSVNEATYMIGVKSHVSISNTLNGKQKYCKKWVLSYNIDELPKKAIEANKIK